ncbi:MAG: phosphate signaling complex protein PhoU [Ignavibacteria bacterium]|jgi:phosphate transport system protein
MHRSFEDDLDKLRTRLIRMGSLVEEQVELAFKALLECNEGLAKLVIERDDKVDKLDIKIDKQCQRIFALQQPVASDLRLLLASIKINNELERIGDMATNISYPVIHDPGVCILVKEFGFDKITSAAYTMVKASLDAFVNNDADLAKHVLPTDSTVDGLERQFKSDIIALMREKPEIIPQGVELISILSNIERMADHATNIAENVIFLFEAKMVRHRHLEEDPLAGDDQG